VVANRPLKNLQHDSIQNVITGPPPNATPFASQ
jgi:hypothetical protein